MLKDIPGYEGLYSIDKKGNVWSYKKDRDRGNRFIKPYLNQSGYWCVALFKDKKQKHFKVHRILGMIYLENKENKPCINHKDSNRANNDLKNLEWCTYSENSKHAFKSGNVDIRNAVNAASKLRLKKINQLSKDGKFIKKWVGIYGTAKRFGISGGSIYQSIKNGYVSGGYRWEYSK